MREIGIIAKEDDARALADYLLTHNITTKVEPRAEAYALWVHREERVSEARAVLAEFEANPADSRFQSASKSAKEIRKEAEKVERNYQKQIKNLRDRWEGSMSVRAPLAFALIIISVVVFLLNMVTDGAVYNLLLFSIRYYDLDGFVKDTGFELIRTGQVWRVITPIFIHIDPLHLLFNMLWLRTLGERIEMQKGTGRFAFLVIVSAVASNFGQFYFKDGYFGGMSGVVYALAGYVWIKGHTDPEAGLSLSQNNINLFLAWFLLGILAPMMVTAGEPLGFPWSLVANMANIAHGVGLLTGVLFGLIRF